MQPHFFYLLMMKVHYENCFFQEMIMFKNIAEGYIKKIKMKKIDYWDVHLAGSTQGRPLLTLEVFLCSRLTPLDP